MLLDMLNSIDLNVRHGAVLATAEILEALYNHLNDKIENIIGEKMLLRGYDRIKYIKIEFFLNIHIERTAYLFRCYGCS